MSIEYVEIRNNSTELEGIIDTAKSIIWHSIYNGTAGDFEIYIAATPKNISLLREGWLVTRPNDIEVGIIEKVNIANNPQDGLMIVAAGRFAKSILDRRLIYNLSGTSNTATVLRGRVEVNVRRLISENAINCAFDNRRNISMLALGDLADIPLVIVDENGNAAEKQVSYANLLDYTEKLLAEYGLGAVATLSESTQKFLYSVYSGINRSVDNENGLQPVVFSQDFDNLTDSEYTFDRTPEKNTALIGGEGEGVDRFYSLLTGGETDLQRREIWIDANSISRTYKDENETEQTYSDSVYTSMLKTKGRQDIAPLKALETFNGSIDVTNGNYVYNEDFFLGDIVTVQDNKIGKYVNVRIQEITEVQDENGYQIEARYQ